MKCPVCGAIVDDGLEVCPACRAELFATRVLPRLKGTWCASCGALVPEGETACPKCGMPVEGARQPKADELVPSAPAEEAEERMREREQTATLPRIESAIPSEPDPAIEGGYGRERLPHTRVIILAAVASVLVVGGATLAITHPWDPTLTDTRATTPADTSQAGFPGTLGRLQGQDSDTSAATTMLTADELTYENLESAYEELADVSARADELEELFWEKATTGSSDERESAASSAEQLSLDASNLVTTIKGIDVVTTGTYTDQRDHLATLASWLRNRVDALCEAWQLSADSTDPEASAGSIEAPMQGQGIDDAESYASLFAKNYAAWAPEQR